MARNTACRPIGTAHRVQDAVQLAVLELVQKRDRERQRIGRWADRSGTEGIPRCGVDTAILPHRPERCERDQPGPDGLGVAAMMLDEIFHAAVSEACHWRTAPSARRGATGSP